MDFLLTLGILLFTFWGVFAGCLIWKKWQTDESFEVKKYPLLAGALYLGVFIPMAAMMFSSWVCPVKVYAFLMLSGLGLLYAVARWDNIKLWLLGLPILCGFGVFILTFLFPGVPFTWYEYILYTLFWSLFMGLFIIFDRVPCCSYLQGLIWGGTAMLTLLLAMIIPIHIPMFFSVLGSILLVVTLGLGKILIKWQMPVLGKYAAVLVSFLWGALFTFGLMNHKVLTVVLMLNSYIFALTFGLVLLWKVTHSLKISYTDFYQNMSSTAQASILSAILKNCGFLSCLGVLFWALASTYPKLESAQFYSGVGIIVLIFFLNLYNRIQNGPVPKIKDILASVVQGVKTGIASGKQEVKEMIALSEAKKANKKMAKNVISNPKKKSVKRKSKNRKK